MCIYFVVTGLTQEKLYFNMEKYQAQDETTKNNHLMFFINHGTYVPPSKDIRPYEIIYSPRENYEDVEIVFGLKTVFKEAIVEKARNTQSCKFADRSLSTAQ